MDVQETETILVHIDADTAHLLDERRIGTADVRKVIAAAGTTGSLFLNTVTGRYLASLRPSTVTYWVEYSPDGDGHRVVRAYSHRMAIVEGFNMPSKSPLRSAEWSCGVCRAPLEQATVKLTYLDETFGVDLPACPSCGHVLVSEENATQKMALAEKMLEDK